MLNMKGNQLGLEAGRKETVKTKHFKHLPLNLLNLLNLLNTYYGIASYFIFAVQDSLIGSYIALHFEKPTDNEHV